MVAALKKQHGDNLAIIGAPFLSSGVDHDDLLGFSRRVEDTPHLLGASGPFFTHPRGGTSVYSGSLVLVRADGTVTVPVTTAVPIFMILDALSTGRPTRTVALAAGRNHACALKPGGTVECWGETGSDVLDGPEGTFTTVISPACSGGGYWRECMSMSQSGPLGTDGTFTAISAGNEFSCGIRADRTVVCWGSNGSGQSDAPEGTFTTISSGHEHSCGVKSGGSVACWGSNGEGRSDAPEGTFTTISSGHEHSCGVKSGGSVVCWGSNGSGQSDAPEGTFTIISSGYKHSCGIKTDRTVACWGDNETGQSDPPEGTFTIISSGYKHSCGIKTDRTVACWGNRSYQPVKRIPPGQFTHVAVPTYFGHSYAISADGVVEYVVWW